MLSRFLVLALSLTSFALPAVQSVSTQPAGHSGPFGFYAGESRDQIIAAVGRSALRKQEEDTIEVSTAPKPYSGAESYLLIISKSVGLVKIVAIGADLENDAYGSDIKSRFERLKGAVTKAHGEPEQCFDFLRSESIWHEPADYMMSLTKKDRTLECFWQGSELGDNVVSIDLEAKGISSSKGYVNVGYEFVGFHNYIEKRKSKDDSVF